MKFLKIINALLLTIIAGFSIVVLGGIFLAFYGSAFTNTFGLSYVRSLRIINNFVPLSFSLVMFSLFGSLGWVIVPKIKKREISRTLKKTLLLMMEKTSGPSIPGIITSNKI